MRPLLEELYKCPIVSSLGNVDRQVTKLVGLGHGGAASKQQRDNVLIALEHRKVQRCRLVV
jgi:hypothetical protein